MSRCLRAFYVRVGTIAVATRDLYAYKARVVDEFISLIIPAYNRVDCRQAQTTFFLLL